MSTTVWKGHIAFGMVSFPVKLQAAARSQSISFHQLHGHDHSRVKQVLYCQAEDRPVARTELVKGFEYEKDRYVVLDEKDLACAEPRSARVMEVLEFVAAAEVDPVYLDTSYYILPETAGLRPYTLLFEAMRRGGVVALAQWTAHNREHLVLLRAGERGLILHTLYYHDEVRAAEEFGTDTSQIQARELELATLLVDSLASAFEPAKYRDRLPGEPAGGAGCQDSRRGGPGGRRRARIGAGGGPARSAQGQSGQNEKAHPDRDRRGCDTEWCGVGNQRQAAQASLREQKENDHEPHYRKHRTMRGNTQQHQYETTVE